MEAVNNAVDIEECLMDPEALVQLTTGRAFQPAQAAVVPVADFVDSAEGDMRLRSVVELEDFAIFVVSLDISLGRVLR
ncbi:hypothetical protein F511_47530 [Dorcoceras hygrometricum]|uniref:Uncharacterized protein n=1 Tax=Dorcoceras hygrometricum TaxID=472368 RepID=A0A2Z6ZQU4_9LAMI|nr:hypothetical protein F511_47530 [Dorcoceras hygrometricum]